MTVAGDDYIVYEMYVGFADHTWRAAFFVYIPKDITDGSDAENTTIAEAAMRRVLAGDESVAFVGVYHVWTSDLEPPGPRDIIAIPQDVQ